MSNKKRVIVAMSGGVDSSLAAALLVQKGYDVIGATMQLWDSNQKNTNEEDNRRCCSSLAIDDARRVAAEIGIPLYIFDFKDYFQKMVIDYFIYEYLNGRTPNPCIACNKYLKFKFFLKKALELGADFIATGHYGRVIFNKKNNRYLLLKGIDYNKDQSYFLYHLNQNILKHFLLPLGNLTKVKTREIAKNFGLSVAEKPDSQEICFISDNNYKKFLREKVPEALKTGNIVDTEKNILGKHKGLSFYTIGQRKGLGILSKKPMYVVSMNNKKNEIIVGNDSNVYSNMLIAGDLNFIVNKLNKKLQKIEIKIRYNSKLAFATINPIEGQKVRVEFQTPQRAITPGQSVVFYNKDVVLGGGIILK